MPVNDQRERDVAPLVPEWPTAVEPRSGGFNNDHLAKKGPSIVRRMLRTVVRVSVAVLIGVGATLAWQSHGDEAKELVSTWIPSAGWLLSMSTTTQPPDQVSAQNTALQQTTPVTQRPAPVSAATLPEAVQLEPMQRDLAVMRHSLEQLVAKQEQMAQNIAALQALEQDIKQKLSTLSLPPAVPLPPRKPPKPTAQSAVPPSSVAAPPPAAQPLLPSR